MSHPLCLAHLSLIELSPPDMVSAAAAAGFELVSLRLAPAAAGEPQHPMIGGTPMMLETLARMQGLGVAVHDVELVRLSRGTDILGCEPFVEAAATLNARQVLVAADDADEGLIADKLSALAELGAPYGLRMGLEFMPWRGIRSLPSAVRLVQAAGTGGVVVDAIHLDRSGGSAADLVLLPPAQWAFFQICDAPARRPETQEELLFQARRARLAPGHGGLDLAGMLRALPPDIVISIEAPLQAHPDHRAPVARARLLRETTLLLMASAHVD